jgi:hypothetical protein
MRAAVAKVILFCAVVAAAASLWAADQKGKKPGVWDSGSFGIFINGKRIGTETFNIEQRPDMNIATSEIKVDDGNTQAKQTAEMQVTPNGELRSYVWRALSPQKEEASVEPKDQLLVEHLAPADQKKMDVPHILPVNTVILDDNFFSQRELLVLRYLATGCAWKPDKGRVCGPSHFGILIPHQHVASDAVIDLVGHDKIAVKGQQVETNKFKLETDGTTWLIWVSEDFKILKMTVPASNVEVVRD